MALLSRRGEGSHGALAWEMRPGRKYPEGSGRFRLVHPCRIQTHEVTWHRVSGNFTRTTGIML